MLYVEPLGGLCNRMRAIASYYSVARETGQALTVVWRRDAGMNCPAGRLFSVSADIVVLERPYSTKLRMRLRSVGRKLTRRAEGRRFDRLFENWEAKKKLGRESVMALSASGSLFASTCYSLESDYEKYDYGFFKPAPDILALADEVSGRFPKRCVGVHIRRTDNVKSIESSPTGDFIARMRREVELDASTGFFLATDSPEEEKALGAAFPGRIITYPKQSLDRDSERGIVDAYVDFLCLSRTCKIYGSFYSSFSRLAAALNRIELEIVTKERQF